MTLLVVVNGPPGAGKTTLARRLADELSLPLFSKDTFKDLLFDALTINDRDWSMKIGGAAVDVLFAVAAAELAAARSAIIENAFVPRFAASHFLALRSKFVVDFAEVWCNASSDVLYERFRRRAVDGNRHPGHVDASLSEAAFKEQLADRAYAPLHLGGVLIDVDTTDFSAIGYDDIVATLGSSVA